MKQADISALVGKLPELKGVYDSINYHSVTTDKERYALGKVISILEQYIDEPMVNKAPLSANLNTGEYFFHMEEGHDLVASGDGILVRSLPYDDTFEKEVCEVLGLWDYDASNLIPWNVVKQMVDDGIDFSNARYGLDVDGQVSVDIKFVVTREDN